VSLPLEPSLLKILQTPLLTYRHFVFSAGACVVYPFCLELYAEVLLLEVQCTYVEPEKSRCRIMGERIFPSLLAGLESPGAPHFERGLEVVQVQPRVGGKLFALGDRHGLVLGACVHFRRVLVEHRGPQHRSPSFRLHLAAT